MTLLKRRTQETAPAWGNYLDHFFNDDFFRFSNVQSQTPAVNISQDEKQFQLDFAVPGFKKEQLTVDLDEQLITVSGQKEENQEDATLSFTRKEFTFSSFKRSFRLPDSVNVQGIQAAYEEGILKITLPKAQPESKAKKAIVIE